MNLSPALLAQVLDEAKTELVGKLLTEFQEIRLLTVTQTAAMLDITTQTLTGLSIPQVRLTPTSSIRYRLSDVRDYIERNRK